MRTLIKPTLTLAVLAGSTSIVFAQGGAKPAGEGGQQAEPVRTLMAFERGRCEDFLKSPKDQALLAALKLIPVRVTEIINTPGLGPDKDEMPEGIVELVGSMFTEPMRMAVTQQGFDDRSRMPKVGFVMSFKAENEGAAKLMMTRVENVRKMAPAELSEKIKASQRYAGMNAIVLPPGTLLYGPRNAADGWRFEVMFGNVPDPDGAMWDALPKAAPGQSVAARGLIDFAAATPMGEMFGGMAMSWVPNGEEVMQGLRDAGFLGTDAMAAEMVWGQDASGMTSTLTVRRAGKFADTLGLVKQTVTEADLAVVPSDAVFASVSKMDPQATWGRLKSQFGAMPGFNEGIGEINQHLGIDLEQDVIASLGNTVGIAMSDTTGGNSMFAGVGFLEIKDPAKMSAALAKVASAANDAIAQEMANDGPKPGTVKIESWAAPASVAALQGVRFTSLRAPGLPLPVEPTIAMVDRWLVVAMSPQACMSAAAHAASKKPGLAANSAFAGSAGDVVGSATSVTFISNAETMADGYAVVQMLGTALTNFARSPDGSGSREVAQVMPTLGELKAGARPGVFVTRWNGEDLVISSRGDPSLLVNLAGVLGTGDLGPMIFGAIVGGGAGHEAGVNEGRMRAKWEHKHHEDHEDEMDDAGEPEMPEPPEAPEAPEAPAAPQPA